MEKVEKTADGVRVSYTDANGKAQVKEAEKVLVAVGRGPLTSGIGLEKTKVELERGFVKVEKRRRRRSRACLPLATLWPGCRNWRTWAR